MSDQFSSLEQKIIKDFIAHDEKTKGTMTLAQGLGPTVSELKATIAQSLLRDGLFRGIGKKGWFTLYETTYDIADFVSNSESLTEEQIESVNERIQGALKDSGILGFGAVGSNRKDIMSAIKYPMSIGHSGKYGAFFETSFLDIPPNSSPLPDLNLNGVWVEVKTSLIGKLRETVTVGGVTGGTRSGKIEEVAERLKRRHKILSDSQAIRTAGFIVAIEKITDKMQNLFLVDVQEQEIINKKVYPHDWVYLGDNVVVNIQEVNKFRFTRGVLYYGLIIQAFINFVSENITVDPKLHRKSTNSKTGKIKWHVEYNAKILKALEDLVNGRNTNQLTKLYQHAETLFSNPEELYMMVAEYIKRNRQSG